MKLCCRLFQKVTSIDLKENEEADVNIILPQTDDLSQQGQLITESNVWNSNSNQVLIYLINTFLELQSSLSGQTVEAILNVAGGWAGGNAADKSK